MLRIVSCIALLMALTWNVQARPDRVTVTQTIEERLPFKSGAELQIENKYGHIVVYTWAKDSVRITCTKTAIAKDEEVAAELLKTVDMNVLSGSKYVRVTTLFAQTKGWLGGMLQKMMEDSRQMLGGQKLEVDYEIYLPVNYDLSIDNRFGNVVLPEVKGSLHVELEHGDLRVSRATGRTTLDLSYGSLRSDYLEQATLDLSFMNVDIVAANVIQLDSKSSDIHLGKIEQLDVRGAVAGSINVAEVNRLMGESTFTDIRAELVKSEITFRSKWGSFTASRIADKFTSIGLECSGTDYYLGVPKQSGFQVIVTSEKPKGISLPKERVTMVKDEWIGENRYVEATFAGGHATRLIRIDAKNSNITLSYVP